MLGTVELWRDNGTRYRVAPVKRYGSADFGKGSEDVVLPVVQVKGPTGVLIGILRDVVWNAEVSMEVDTTSCYWSHDPEPKAMP